MAAKSDVFFMRRALELARRGTGRVHPNPLVGAVLVRGGKVLGEGAHEKFGGPHAEVRAISRASDARDATLYITLEPCAHFGKTPPCVDLIIRRKIGRVVIAARDPHPLVNGRGFRALKKAGIPFTSGVLTEEADALNRDYARWVQKKMPYAILKIAQSLDGKIATSTGQSRWITGIPARECAHEFRASCDAVLVGSETILKDNPLLSVRLARAPRQPIKIILDSRLRVSPHARIFSKASPGAVILAATQKARAKAAAFQGKAMVLFVKEKNGRINVKELFGLLAQKGIVRLLVEGGGETTASVLAEGLAQEIYCFIAPKIIGGKEAAGSVGGKGISSLEKAVRIRGSSIRKLGKDFLIHGYL